MQQKVDRILRDPEPWVARGISRSNGWGLVKKGLYTPPVRLGPNSVGWPESDVAAINAAIIAGFSDDQIRDLVRRLEAKREAIAAELLAAVA